MSPMAKICGVGAHLLVHGDETAIGHNHTGSFSSELACRWARDHRQYLSVDAVNGLLAIEGDLTMPSFNASILVTLVFTDFS
jgi:hypothetical protein